MKQIRKYIFLLLLLNIVVTGTVYLLVTLTPLNFHPADVAFLSFLFSVISVITLIIFLRGQEKDPESQTMHSLVAVGLKFLLEMVLALGWFIVAKKTSIQSVIIFFVLYLTLTLFSVCIILKTLKNKSLNNKF